MAFNKKLHLENNIKALQVAFELDLEKRLATNAEKEILKQYSGFGGLKFILNPANDYRDIQSWTKSNQMYSKINYKFCTFVNEFL
ncbi:hypothetical protein EQP59_05280 [Ornithobacterium rhinotracheale]|uniref:Uncharacterized protein n=1 Tax=Ornithobacterium rhinotracheale TaxID=28251 RepID=A0A410JRM2_ORNRH|nr:hypothetical protein [Ornithobacterium rhinotracheale]QAR30789.1 hypothetical protein EQP59_05280 [Ornithobacterium rhinotracheale]